MEILGVFAVIGMIGLAIVFRLIAGSFDGDRVERYVQEQGWELVDRSWDPFGPGWYGEKDSRIYQIKYRDRQGNLHKSHVKTSMLSGVYLTNDEIIESSNQQAAESLAEENLRLKERIRELEQGREDRI